MMEARKFGDLAFHACDFAFDDCGTPHLPDAGDAVLRLRQLEPVARKALACLAFRRGLPALSRLRKRVS
ncbi:hypothetical protein CTATCC11996_10303 [Comamonas testosteroni ATCC 11996]|nr:hypothetical protein CTATCC11996_10303 [Comamonas testosteroni ATCC 11996]